MMSYSRLLLVLVALVCVATGGNLRRKKQVGTGISFAIPGLQLLGGGSNNNLGNLFGGGTFTRTLVSTVSTVTTASFRTCTTTVAALMPCAGRRRRSADMLIAPINFDENDIYVLHDSNDIRIEPTASIALIVAGTTISDPLAVSEYLVAHQPNSQSIIYPQDVTFSEIQELQSDIAEQTSTVLYPSNDSPEQEIDVTTVNYAEDIHVSDDAVAATTEVPSEVFDEADEITTPANDDIARAGFGAGTTVTTIIRVTSVATTLATGAMATLTVQYMGCLPPSLPISGVPC